MNRKYNQTVKDHSTSKYQRHIQEIFEELVREKNKTLVVTFNSTLRYTNIVLSIISCFFHTYVDQIYRSKLEIKDTKEFVSYLGRMLTNVFHTNC